MNKKLLLLICLIVGISKISNAQVDTAAAPAVAKDTLWKKGGIIAINFNQVALDNWAAGGENSFSLTGLTSLFAYYKKDKVVWDNNLDLGYGLLKQGTAKTRKNEDKIDLSSKVGYDAYKSKWYYTFLFNFKSQFDNGYALPNDSEIVSKFLAPGYFTSGFGMDYKPNDHFSLYISPITSKITVVNDQALADQGLYGVDPAEYSTGIIPQKIKDGKKLRTEFGASLTAKFRKEVMTNVVLNTKLELFSNYADHPENVDVNWELLIAMKVNKYITASIYTQLIYDDNIPVPIYEGTGDNRKQIGAGPRTQFKEVLGVGISYSFRKVTLRN
jgi:hypothetical protein